MIRMFSMRRRVASGPPDLLPTFHPLDTTPLASTAGPAPGRGCPRTAKCRQHPRQPMNCCAGSGRARQASSSRGGIGSSDSGGGQRSSTATPWRIPRNCSVCSYPRPSCWPGSIIRTSSASGTSTTKARSRLPGARIRPRDNAGRADPPKRSGPHPVCDRHHPSGRGRAGRGGHKGGHRPPRRENPETC